MKKFLFAILLIPFFVISCAQQFTPEPQPQQPPEEIPLTAEEIGLVCIKTTMNSIYISWNKQQVVSDYNLSWYKIVDEAQTLVSSKTISSNSLLINNLKSATEYCIKLSFVVSGKTITEHAQINVLTNQVIIPDWELSNYKSDTTNGVKISLSSLPSDEVESIEILKSTNNLDFNLLKKITSDYSKTYFIDTDVTSLNTYFYKLVIGEVQSESKEILFQKSINLIETSEVNCNTGYSVVDLSWPKDSNATSYVVEQLENILPDSKILRTINTETSSVKITGLEENADSFFRIYGINETITGPKSQVIIVTTNKFIVGQLDVKTTQVSATITVDVQTDSSEEISFSLIEVNSKKEIATSKTNVISLENLNPGYHFGKDSLQIIGTLSYKYLDEQILVSQNNSFVPEFSTLGLNPPKNISLSKMGRKTLIFNFDKIDDEETFGLTPIYAIRKKGTSLILAQCSSSPMTVENLQPGADFDFEFFTTFQNEYQYAEHVVQEVKASTVGQLSKPVITSVTEENISNQNYQNKLTVNWNSIPEAENENYFAISYKMEYKIFKAGSWKSTNTIFAGQENYSDTIKVNRGNIYRIAISYSIEDDKDFIYYSEPEIYQAESISNPQIFGAMKYTATNDLGFAEGDLVDIGDDRLWGNKSIRWTEEEMAFGKLDLFSGFVSDEEADPEDEVDLTKNFVHSDASERYTVILTLTDQIRNSDNLLKLILFDKRSVLTESEISEVYSSFDFIEIFKPYADSIPSTRTPLTTYAKDGAYEQLNAPNFLQQEDFSLATDDKVQDIGIVIDENYIYNNCIVISVRKKTHEAGFYGFSYYY